MWSIWTASLGILTTSPHVAYPIRLNGSVEILTEKSSSPFSGVPSPPKTVIVQPGGSSPETTSSMVGSY